MPAPVPAAALAPPRLGPWSRTWRYLLAVGSGLVFWVFISHDLGAAALADEDVAGGLMLLDLTLGLVAVGLLPLRRRRPLLIAVLITTLTALSAFAIGPAMLALVSLATRRRWREVAVVGAVWVLASTVYEVLYQGSSASEDVGVPWLLLALGLSLLLLGLLVATGFYVGARRELLQTLRLRAEAAERAQESRAAEARQAERTRIAREMHDIVAHKISLVALQAGALEVNPDMGRAQVQQSASLIRGTATTALSELREVLGVLRGDEEQAPLAPQPTWEDVRRLVTTSQEAGVSVDLFDFIDDPVPDPLARTAFRVVQEGLTNIHKHALHTRARVALIGEPGTDLVIEVSNVLPKGFTTDLPGARMGLSGIETRVTHAGGSITSGPTDDGRFEVRAVIPWPTAT